MIKKLYLTLLMMFFIHQILAQGYFGASGGIDNFNFNRINSSAVVDGNEVNAFLEKYSRTPTIGGDYIWLPGKFIFQIDASYNSTGLADLGKKEFTYNSFSDSVTIDGFDQLIHLKGGLGYNFSEKHILSFIVNGEALWGNFVYFNDIYSSVNNFSLNNIDLEDIENSMTYGLSIKGNLGLKVSNLFAVSFIPGYSFVWNNKEDTGSKGFDFVFGIFRAL